MRRSEGAAGWEPKAEKDVLVRLLHPNDLSCLFALPLHSPVLVSRSEFFAVRLSHRWDPQLTSSVGSSNTDITTSGIHDERDDKHDATIDIVLSDSSTATTYKECLELMYVPRKLLYSCRRFSTVGHAISMLFVAAELLFHDCIDHCMQCLEMLPSWTAEEEASIRATLSSLQLTHMNTDLAARLSFSQSIPSQQPMFTMRRMLVHVLEMACERLPTPRALKNIDTSKPIPEATILLVWNANLDMIKAALKAKLSRSMSSQPRSDDVIMASLRLSWLFMKLLDLEAADAVVRAFVEDASLSSLTQELMKSAGSGDYHQWSPISAVLSILNKLMPAVFGKVLLSRAARMTLITTWLPVVQGVSDPDRTSCPNVFESFPKLLSSLPVLDREQIYKKFLKHHNSELSLIASFGPWCENLRHLHLEHGKVQDSLLATIKDI